MDRLEAMVALAYVRLRLQRLSRIRGDLRFLERGLLAMSDTTRPKLKIRMPIELAGMRGRLHRAENQEREIKNIGTRYDAVQDGIDDAIDAHKEHVGALEVYHSELRRKIEGMVASNGGDPLEEDGQTGRQSETISSDQVGKVGQIISSKTES